LWQQGGVLLDERGRPIFAEGENAERMLNVLRFLRRTVRRGRLPSRVATFIVGAFVAGALKG
jgi:multiple sugar transport system substrate-binding protein